MSAAPEDARLELSEDALARIDEAVSQMPEPRGALLHALHVVHEELGHVSTQTARALAARFGIRPVEVLEVVSFYNMFRARPEGRHHVYVCTNLSCSLRGARDLLRALEAHLGVSAGRTTADGRITLHHDECLSACSGAPMLRIGDVYHEDLDVEAAKRLVDGLD